MESIDLIIFLFFSFHIRTQFDESTEFCISISQFICGHFVKVKENN